MPKNTLQLEERDCLTLADLVSEALEGGEKADVFHKRSLVRLAVKVHEMAGPHPVGRVAVLSHAPSWVFGYLARPLFPGGVFEGNTQKPRKRPKPKPPAEG